jgi:hypothetical protein
VSLKFVEVFILLIAGCLFVVWQMRDLRKAREETRLAREAQKRDLDAEKAKDSHAP